jgi:parallel beta-helix repeat protein
MRARGALLIATLALVGTAPAAEARTVTCGEVITEDTVVSNDLDCVTSGAALVIGADDVTLNLNGHTITAEPDFSTGANTDGILSEQNDGVVIRNGYVEASTLYGTGILVTGGGNRIANVSVTGSAALTVSGPDNVVARTTAVGIRGELVGDRLVARDSQFDFSAYLEGSRQRVVRNAFFEVTFVGLNNVIRANRIERATLDTVGSIFARNRALGVEVSGRENYVAYNRVTGGTGGTGLRVLTGATGNYLRGNVATGNYVGITIQEPTNVLQSNVANDNVGLGIDAVPGTVDDGGNTATGNGDPRQCVGVACG